MSKQNKTEKQLCFSNTEDDFKKISNLRKELLVELNDSLKEINKEAKKNPSAFEVFYKIKFEPIGNNAIRKFFGETELKVNFIEQIHQTFTYLVVLTGLECLIAQFKDESFCIEPATNKGFDIKSLDEKKKIVAECFAVVSKNHNKKIKKDQSKFGDEYEKPFIFYYESKDEKESKKSKVYKENGIIIISLAKEQLFNGNLYESIQDELEKILVS